jgi:hypothetical protein
MSHPDDYTNPHDRRYNEREYDYEQPSLRNPLRCRCGEGCYDPGQCPFEEHEEEEDDD